MLAKLSITFGFLAAIGVSQLIAQKAPPEWESIEMPEYRLAFKLPKAAGPFGEPEIGFYSADYSYHDDIFVRYHVVYEDLYGSREPDTPKTLAQMVEQEIASFNPGKVSRNRAILLNGLKGREFEYAVEKTADADAAYIKERVFQVDGQYYIIWCEFLEEHFTSGELDRRAALSRIDTFLNSVTIKATPSDQVGIIEDFVYKHRQSGFSIKLPDWEIFQGKKSVAVGQSIVQPLRIVAEKEKDGGIYLAGAHVNFFGLQSVMAVKLYRRPAVSPAVLRTLASSELRSQIGREGAKVVKNVTSGTLGGRPTYYFRVKEDSDNGEYWINQYYISLDSKTYLKIAFSGSDEKNEQEFETAMASFKIGR